ncbi:Cyclin-dependent kinase-like 2 [Cryptotermes secundus]|uniref:cyclin-dependent kinase n=1 Tax=Cryptotermes secundus TaxID=105785 RepID=A0A2J7QHD6_9NEOP|nr:cyclin-dependent kinase 17 isoform X2 [Cryptotermes secundus]PNF28008.1 Cyclin-dependent kinase-like 2 [Cryptotermes secundus]
MEKYENISVVGEGSYGLVMKCRHRETGQLVAIKKFIETEEDQNVRKMALREIRMLKKLRHENLVNMIEVFRRKRRFYLVFEYMDHTILDELEDNTRGLGEETSRKYIFQVLRGIDFCHANNIVHRDVKPENVLVSQLGVIKLCDFGFARLLATPGATYTDYVATRWYRAPELLVGDTKYGREVDIWAVGCLFAEMMSGDPLFPGDSDIDQLYQITKLLGKLSSRHQQLVSRNAMFKGLKRSTEDRARSLYKLFPAWPPLALDFVSQCLRLDPSHRSTSTELIQHLYFTDDHFSEHFLPLLREKIQQEFQGNPLLQKYEAAFLVDSSARKARGFANSNMIDSKGTGHHQRRSLIEPRWKIIVPSENSSSRRIIVDSSKPVSNRRKLSDNNSVSSNMMEVSDEASDSRIGGLKMATQSKLIVPSKLHMPVQDIQHSGMDVQPPSGSPTPFQSLEAVGSQVSSLSHVHQSTGDHFLHINMQVLHPSINNLSFSGMGVENKSGFSGKMPEPLKRSPLAQGGRVRESHSRVTPVRLPPRTQFLRRLDHGLLLDVGQLDKTGTNSSLLSSESPTNEKWLGAKKMGTTRTYDTWKTPKTIGDDFSLPNVPGASGSPSKGLKKQLNPVTPHADPASDLRISPRGNPSHSSPQSPRSRFSSNLPHV